MVVHALEKIISILVGVQMTMFVLVFIRVGVGVSGCFFVHIEVLGLVNAR